MHGNISVKVLITGGSGFLGQAIIKQLIERGDQVRIFDLNAPSASSGVEFFCGNITDNNAILKAAKGVDAIIHCASKVTILGRYQDFYNINVLGTRAVINACLQLNIKYLVYSSSHTVVFPGKDVCGGNENLAYPNHFLSYYPQTKAMAEQMVLAANNQQLKTVALRPQFIWGPGDKQFTLNLIDRARAGKLALVKGPTHLVDTIYVDNAAYAHVLALDCLVKNGICAGKPYFVSQDHPISINQFANEIISTAQLPPINRYIPEKMLLPLGTLAEWLYAIFPIKNEPVITRFSAKLLVSSHWFDISNAKRDLGYTPNISMEEGLKHLETWLKTNKY